MVKCVICKKQEVSEKYHPFCGKHCADMDLYHWTTERYTVPADDMAYEESIPDTIHTTH